MKIGVIGAGAWGTALAITAGRGGNETILWSYDGQYKEFDGVAMPSNLSVTKELSDVKDTDVWLIVTPSAFLYITSQPPSFPFSGTWQFVIYWNIL